MKILISIKDEEEAKTVSGMKGIDIIDIKNPDEGTLGANNPWTIKKALEYLPSQSLIAASIGDLDFKPGSASLASYGTALLGVDFVTAAYMGLKTQGEIKSMTKHLIKSLEDFDSGLIVAGYADHKRLRSPDPNDLITEVGGADYFMLDTAIKDGRSVLDFAPPKKLLDLKKKAENSGLKLIIAGSIRYPQLKIIREIDPHMMGFRGILCDNGAIKKELLERLIREIR